MKSSNRAAVAEAEIHREAVKLSLFARLDETTPN
jgi:hypothetical protein